MDAVLFPPNVQVSGGMKDEDDIRLFIEPILINSQRNNYKRNSQISLELHFLQFAAVVRPSLSLAQAVLFLD